MGGAARMVALAAGLALGGCASPRPAGSAATPPQPATAAADPVRDGKASGLVEQPLDRGTGPAPAVIREEALRLAPGESASLAVALDEPGTYVVMVHADDEDVDPTLKVHDAHDALLAENDDFRNRRYSAVVVSVTKAMPVTVEVGCLEDSGGPATLRVQRVGWPQPGERVDGDLTTFAQWDWYWLRAEAGSLYRFATSGAESAADPLIVLCQPDGDLYSLCEADDRLRDDRNARLDWSCPADGVYALAVTAADAEKLGAYTLAVDRVAELP